MVLDAPFSNTANVLGGTAIAAPGPYTISSIPGEEGASIFVYAFWDVDGSSNADPANAEPNAGDRIGDHVGNPVAHAVNNANVDIIIADTAGAGFSVSGQVTSTLYTGSEVGLIYVVAFDGPDPNFAKNLGTAIIPGPVPVSYSIASIVGNPEDDVYLFAFWDVDGSGPEFGPNQGDYYGFYGGNPFSVTGNDTGIDLAMNNTKVNGSAHIAGTLTDVDGPVAGVWVQAFDAPCGGNYLDQALSNSEGQYLIENLAPGNVYLNICAGCNHSNYLHTWYGAFSWDENCGNAEPVPIAAGQTANGVDFTLERGPKILSFFDLAVYDGNLQPGFALAPWAADLLESATLSFPNPARPDYTFDLVADKLIWDSECRKLDDYWYHKGGPVVPADYGPYTLTLTSKGGLQKIYTGTLDERTIVGANDDASLTVNVSPDGSLDFGWTHDGVPAPDQVWQIRVREFDGGIPGKEIYRGGTFPSDTISAHIDPGDLGCLEIGHDYRVRVRSWSFDNQRAETVERTFSYTPAAFIDRYAWVDVMKTEGNLALGFDVRPGSREDVVSATVAWPGAAYTYNFNLGEDGYDISTKTRTNKGWWVADPAFPVVTGDYIFTINYSDGYTDTVTKTFADTSVSGIDPASMKAIVQPDGAVAFSWNLPPTSNQKYQVRIRSLDGSREYFKSLTITDDNQITIWPYDLRGLVPGRTYSWRVRVMDTNFNIRERAISSFFYDPHQIGGPDVIQWFDVAVYDGSLKPVFIVFPGFRDKLREAYIKIPNPNRAEYPEYRFDLANDRLLWDSECRFVDAWVHDFGLVQPEDYGEYTLVLVFDTDPPGSTENFRVRTHTFNLHEATVTPANQASMGVAVNPDGSVDVNWTPEAAIVPGQNWQVRVREAETDREVYRSPDLPAETSFLTIPAEDLRCLALGGNYKWLVRAYDPDFIRAETRFVTQIYGPDAISDNNRVTYFYLADHRGKLGAWFSLRPGDRDRLLYANVTGPNGVNYTYDPVNDYDDMSTATRINRGWWYGGTGANLSDGGVYTLTVHIDENNNGTYEAGTDTEVVINETLTLSALTNIEANTMSHMINPDGSIHFSWALPDGVTGQYYHIRIRNMDHSLEYVRTESLADNNNIHLSFWDLRGLVHGEQYIWFIRVFDDDFDTMVQSASKTFLYDPFYLYSDPVPPDLQERIDAGLQWLRDNQNGDGSWGDPGDQEANLLGATEFAVMAFLNNGYSQNPGDGNYDAALENGLNNILSHVIPVDPHDQYWMDGAIAAPDGMAMNYTTAIGVLALVAADRINAVPQYTTQISNALLKITQMQNNEDNITGVGYNSSAPSYGGWGYGDPWPGPNGSYWGDMSNSQWDILALYEARDLVNPAIIDPVAVDLALSRAITFLEHCQNRPASNPLAWAHDNTHQDFNDGGLLYNPDQLSWQNPTDSWSQTISTYAGIWGYISTDVLPGDGRIDDALDWAKNDNHFAGWYSWFNRPYYAYYTAAKALTMSGEAADTVNASWYQDLSEQLLMLQEPDGRWANVSRDREGGDALTTAYALLSLATGKDSPTSTIAISVTGGATALTVTKPDGTEIAGLTTVSIPQGEVASGTYVIDVDSSTDTLYTLTINGDDGVQHVDIDRNDVDIDAGERHRYELVITYITGFRLELVSGPISTNPHITMQEPTVARTADDVFRITWIDGDIDSNAMIDLYYDADGAPGGGVPIVAGIHEDGANYFDWDVSGLGASGPYYISGTISDGVSNAESFSAGTVTISPDGMPKAWEEVNGLDVYRDDSGDDIDGDGLTNLGEYNASTNPRNPDSEGDGMPDGWEVANSLDPNVDDAGLDPDGDLFTNLEEWQSQSNPQNPASSPPYPPGDLNKDRNIDLLDAALILQVLAGMNPADADSGNDINGDGKIGIEELLHVLQVVAALREPLSIPYSYLQYRTLPCGMDRYQGWIELTKYGLAIEDGDIFRIEMKDEAGNDTGAYLSQYYESLYYFGKWNEGTQSVDYSGPSRYTGYSVRFPEHIPSLPEGDYTYTVVPAVGPEISKTFHFPGQAAISVVSFGTINYEWMNGDLRISWINPGTDFDQLRIVLMDKNWIDRLYVRLPNDMAEIVIPSEVIGNITGIADIDPIAQSMRLQIQTRKYFEDPISHPYDYARGFDCIIDVPWP